MSLRKSACLTPRRLDANRRNSQRSTGPRSQAGKERMKLNALKHGCDAVPENDAAVMGALGEDPAQYEALKQELSTAYGPGDALWDQQIDDLCKLEWRRNRIERMQTGLMRRALEAIEERRRSLPRSLAAVTFTASQCEAVAFNQPQPNHPLVKLRMQISILGVILDQVRRRVFAQQQQYRVDSYYEKLVGWRPRQISHLLQHFANWGFHQYKQDPARAEQYVKEHFGNQAGFEARHQELVRLLEEQIGEEEAAFAEEMAAQEEKDAMERDACLAPEGETWEMLLRQEAALDRSIDRKVRILMAMRKEHQREGRSDSRAAPADEHERPGRSGSRTAPTEAEVSATADRTDSPSAEDAPKTSNSPEQSQNVDENKGSETEVAA